MRLFWLVFFFIAFLTSQAAYSRDVKVGNSTISVSAPAGFCEVDTANKADDSWLTSSTDLFKASGNYLIAGFPDCREMARARKAAQFIVSKVFITAPLSGIEKLKPETVQQDCQGLHTAEYSEQDKVRNAKMVKEFGKGNSLSDSKALGVLEEVKGVVCYVATLQKVKVREGDSHTLLVLFAVTSAQNSELFLYQVTPYVDASSLPTALANLKIIYSDFARANPK
jgi:hypothetical protein